MKITNLSVKNFRNYKFAEVKFGDGLNIVKGRNAQGKTNLLEAVYFCCIGKSLRVPKEKQAIMWDSEKAEIKLETKKKFGKSEIEIILSKNMKKTVRINKIPIRKIGELMGEFNAVFFSPDELKLVKESPEDRRRFMDISLSQTSKEYFYLLSNYEKILSSRNRLLKQGLTDENLCNTIDIWDEQLANTGSKIIVHRKQFLKNLAPYVMMSHEYLTDKSEKLEIEYSGIKGEDFESIKTKFLKSLKDSFEKDKKLNFTSVGPHRDDIKITVNQTDLRTFGSQGQQRTAALALKLAEVEIFEKQTGERPVLILDDVLSELDIQRKKRLLNFCKKTQTILSCTEFEFSDIPHTEFVVSGGEIKK